MLHGTLGTLYLCVQQLGREALFFACPFIFASICVCAWAEAFLDWPVSDFSLVSD